MTGSPGMGPEDARLREEVAALPWLQSLRLGPTLVTPGARTEAELRAEEAALLDPLPLAGAHLLEIGAANGYFSFAALRRQAAWAVVTDHVAWTLPGAQAQAATELAARALGLPVHIMPLDPRGLSAEFGQYDIVLATGFCEQMFNPILALGGMAAVTSGVMMLDTLQDALDEPRPMMTATLRPMPYNAMIAGWAPNPPVMGHLLHQLGFDRVLYRPHPTQGAARGLYAALKPGAPAGMAQRFGAPWTRLPPSQA